MPQAARHRIERRREAGGHARGIIAQRKMLVPQNFEAAGIEQRIEIGQPEIDQVARHVDAVPALAQQQKLPAGGVGDLDDQAAVGPQQLVRGFEIAGRIVQMFEHVKHRDGGAARRAPAALWKASRRSPERRRGARRHSPRRAKNRGPTTFFTPRSASICRNSPPPHPTSSTSACFFRFAQRALDETQMIAQHEAAVDLLQAVRGIGVGGVPVVRRIVIAAAPADAAADRAGSGGSCGIRRCGRFCWWCRTGGRWPKTARATRVGRRPGRIRSRDGTRGHITGHMLYVAVRTAPAGDPVSQQQLAHLLRAEPVLGPERVAACGASTGSSATRTAFPDQRRCCR